jgi:hypothetical protein
MVFLLLLLVFSCASLATEWLPIALLGNDNVTIHKITWCGSMDANPNTRSKRHLVRELQHCSDPGLLHTTLYPSEQRKVSFEQLGHVLIDLRWIQPLSDRHQAQIHIEGVRQNAGIAYEQVVTLNPLYEEHVEKLPAQTAPAHDSSGDSSGEFIPVSESYTGMVTLLGIGMSMVLAAGIFLHLKRKRQYNGALLIVDPAADLVQINRAREEEDLSGDEELERLLHMGKGASSVFMQNL